FRSIFHRRVWAKLVSEPHGVTVYLGGTAYKGQIDFDREFHRLSELLKALRSPTAYGMRGEAMFRSLFLFDVTFWLYLAAVGLYFSYLVASQKALRPAYAVHPPCPEEGDGWA